MFTSQTHLSTRSHDVVLALPAGYNSYAACVLPGKILQYLTFTRPSYCWLMPLLAVVVLPVLSLSTLDASARSLLGRQALVISSALPLERDECLRVADAALAAGASVKLLVPTPSSGSCAADSSNLDLLQLMQRRGFPLLMEALGFAFGGVAGQYGLGNRPRIEFQHVRADDVEALSLALADADVLFVHTPADRLAPSLERARFRLQRRMFTFLLHGLKAQQIVLRHDDFTPRLRWAWLDKGT